MNGLKVEYKKILNIVLTLLMLLSSVTMSPVKAEDYEPSILKDIVAIVSQDGGVILEGGTIDTSKEIEVDISFGVPVKGDFDEPIPSDTQFIKKGDTVKLQLSDAFTLLSSNTIELKMGTIKVGTASFVTDPITKMVTATITFDGDDEVFDGTSNTVTAQFKAKFKFDGESFGGNPEDYVIKILQKEYSLYIPPLPISFDVTKTGVVDLATQSILWTVNLTALQGTNNIIDLAGLEFFDNLQSVGTYVADSFTVNSVPTPITITNNQIAYLFPEGTNTPATITFRTKISDTAYYATSDQSITNTALLRKTVDSTTTTLDQGQSTVTFTPSRWISKEGVSSDKDLVKYDPTNRTITWIITANPDGASLNDVVITDVLPNHLTFKEAYWEVWNGSSWVSKTSISPDENHKYGIGNINSKIRLTIVSNVPDQSNVTGTTTYNNSASIDWEGIPVPAISTGNVPVTVGYNAIEKKGEIVDISKQLIKWTVNVDVKEQVIPDLKVYDLLVYGNSITLSTVTGLPEGLNQDNLTPQFGQKYASNFSGSTNLVEKVIGIYQGSTRVADLIEVTGFLTNSANSFSFDSQVVDPNIFAGNKESDVLNTANLFSKITRLNTATGTVKYLNRMLDKRFLDRDVMSNPILGVNTSTIDKSKGFNYIEKTAVFRLSINADGIDLPNLMNANGEKLGTVTVTDTLPEGWEFVEIIPGQNYLIFEGNLSNNIVDAIDKTPDIVDGLTYSISGRIATFNFTELNKPYVILIKAKVTDELAEVYFSSNQKTTEINTVNLKTEKWIPGVNESQEIEISSTILNKDTKKPREGELLWTVNYQPYNTNQIVDRIEDILPIGIDLRINSSGTLLIAGNITMHEMSLNADGSYTLGSEVPLILGSNINYDNSTRTLSFKIVNSSKAYKITYKTDITGEPGTVTNFVKLIGNDNQIEDVGTPYEIIEADGSASLLRNGWLSIKKTNGVGNDLANAQFTLFASDNKTVIKTGQTGANGILTFRVIPDGDYILRETTVPNGYSAKIVDYSVKVRTVDGVVTTSIGGNTNLLNVQNFLVGTVGNLVIEKTVTGDGADTERKFDFTLNLTGASGEYNYVGKGVSDGIISSGDTISLAHGQSITVLGIPLNATYSVVEKDYTIDGYSVDNQKIDGTIIVDSTQFASFINTYDVGNLAITKTVKGTNLESDKIFDFVVAFEGASGSYRFIKSGSIEGTITSGDVVSLAHGQTITIIGLPKGATYNVAELDYSKEGYTTISASDSGTIEVGKTQIASFINDRNIGNLKISKTVVGSVVNVNKEFTFTLNLEDTQETYIYIGEGVPNGSIKNGGQIKLKHNQSITVIGLPKDTKYKVQEEDYSYDGYSTDQTVNSGIIEVGKTQNADFINTYELGNLSLKKIVSGNAADRSKSFNFTINFEGVKDRYRYIGEGVEGGFIKSGDTISLAHNQSITIIGLPYNSSYSIVEQDYSNEGYSTVSTNATGTIELGSTQISVFTNTKSYGLPKTGITGTSEYAKWMLAFFSVMLVFLIRKRLRFSKK